MAEPRIDFVALGLVGGAGQQGQLQFGPAAPRREATRLRLAPDDFRIDATVGDPASLGDHNLVVGRQLLFAPNRTPGSKPRLDTPTPKFYSLPVHATGATAKDRILTEIAERLFWWIPPQDALEDQARFVAQVMALGTDRDVKSVEARLGSEVFDRILDNPPPGLFSLRRWNYWHVRQHRNPVPPLPRRFSE